MKQGFCGDVVYKVVHAKVATRFVEEFCDAGMSREFAKAIRARYKVDGIELKDIPSLAEQRAYVRNLDARRTSDVSEGIDDEEENWDFENMVAAEIVASSGLRGKLLEVQRICEDGDEAVPTTILEVVELACDGIKMKHKSVALTDQNMDLEAELLEARAVGGTMFGQLARSKLQRTALQMQLADAHSALEKLVGKASRTEGDL